MKLSSAAPVESSAQRRSRDRRLKRHGIREVSYRLQISVIIGKQSKHHELMVDDDEAEKLIKINDSDLPGDPRRVRITKENIDKVGCSDGCMGCNAMRAAKPAQTNSEYCRRRIQDDLKGTEESRQRLEKAEQ